ncbi:uncharacterized protein RSE6_13051 [Rhynchosporium secalis]|uniref:Uncharacterized protein n=1 Tax=Rhynchosporium secalis TaxID=38038 RepID=A0A1E1MSR8_RHYSE|nr:uncharacterized protein RSE6_13051 [Rhynchosporium secalis]
MAQNFSKHCTRVSFRFPRLYASCRDFQNKLQSSSFDLSLALANVGGQLQFRPLE